MDACAQFLEVHSLLSCFYECVGIMFVYMQVFLYMLTAVYVLMYI